MVHTIQQLKCDCGINILPPVFAISRNGDLPVGPFAGEMDANAGYNGWTVLQAEGGQVQTAARKRHTHTHTHK